MGVALLVALMRRKQSISGEKQEVEKASRQTLNQKEDSRLSDRKSIREMLDRRHDVSVILVQTG